MYVRMATATLIFSIDPPIFFIPRSLQNIYIQRMAVIIGSLSMSTCERDPIYTSLEVLYHLLSS